MDRLSYDVGQLVQEANLLLVKFDGDLLYITLREAVDKLNGALDLMHRDMDARSAAQEKEQASFGAALAATVMGRPQGTAANGVAVDVGGRAVPSTATPWAGPEGHRFRKGEVAAEFPIGGSVACYDEDEHWTATVLSCENGRSSWLSSSQPKKRIG